MASRDEPQTLQSVASPQHFTPPSARELRAQSTYRIQIGLFGLAAMLLLVALANVIMDRARQVDAGAQGAQGVAQTNQAPSDPLADIGVVPSAPESSAQDVDAPTR